MTRRHLLPLLLLVLLVGCGDTDSDNGNGNGNGDGGDGLGPPPGLPSDSYTARDGTRFIVQTLVTGLEIPWGLAFAPDGRLFVTERPGRVRIVRNGRLLSTPALVLDDVFTTGESGVMGIALHPNFNANGYVYLTYTARTGGAPVVRLVRFRELNDTLAEPVVLLDDVPAANIHNGSRVKFGPDGRLYVTFGDVAVPSLAQDVAALNGKILRLTDEGTSAPGNRFGPVFSYGHRNPQGLDWHPVTGDLWESEHGQTGNDELNVIDNGVNYGWPEIEGSESAAGMRRPIRFFTPAVAPSGIAFYTGSQVPAFRNELFVATLRGMALLRVRLDTADPRRVASIEPLVEGRYGRLRDIVTGPDGFLYFCTSNRDGRNTPVDTDDRIFRIIPAS